MDELPEVVRIALQNASKSGRALSWKVQENTKGTLIQLVWKHPQEIRAELKGHTKISSGAVGSNLNKSKTAAGMPVAAGEPQKRRRNNPSRLRRNARRLQYFLDRKASQSGNEPPQPVVTATVLPSNTTQETANEEQVEQTEADDLKGFIEKNVLCVDFAIKDGQPTLDLELANGSHMWTPVQVKKPKSLSDEPVEPHADDISTSELSKLDSIEYRGRDSDDAPGVILRKGSLEVWTPIAARLRPRIREKT